MSKKYFQFNATSTILIYGAGGLGREIAGKLMCSGYKIGGFIDKNADIIKSVDNLDVYTLTSAWEKFDADDTIIVICLHNALWHSEPARQLYEKGFNNIIFLPIDGDYNICEKKRMEYIYDSIKDGVYEDIKDIPLYNTLSNVNYDINDGVIVRNNKTVTVWMEINSIYSNDVLKERGNDITKRYGDVSVAALKPYIEMYKYCEDGNGDIELYCHAFKGVQNAVDDINVREFINDRVELYDVLKQELNAGIQYFVQSAPLLKWNYEQKHFNVHEGHHRLIFLLSQGLNMAPVKMTVQDFETWSNGNAYKECIKYISKKNINKWSTPINHPGLYYLPAKRRNIYSIIASKLHNILSTENVKEMSVLDYSCTGGYFSRMFKSMGVSKIVCGACDEDANFILKLNKLFYYDDIVVSKIDLNELLSHKAKANIGIIKLLEFDNEVLSEIFDLIDKTISDYLIIESIEGVDIENYFRNGKFRNIIHLKKNVSKEGVSDFWLMSVNEIKE